MADMFLELDGISGESLDFDHGNAMEIKDWQWTTTNDAPLKMDQNDATQKTKVIDVQVTKWCDRASVTLTQYCAIGKTIPKGWITCRRKAGEDEKGDSKKIEYLTIELTDVKISHVNWTVGPEERVQEVVKLNFAQFKVEYTLQDNWGTEKGKVGFGFDITNHKPI